MKKLLIAEDNPSNQKLFKMLLDDLDCQVIIASNGKEAVELAVNEKPNLILMDVQMPELDGISAMQELRKKNDFENLPIIAVTSYAMIEDKDKFLKLGFTDYLSKPIKPEDYLEKIRNFLAV